MSDTVTSLSLLDTERSSLSIDGNPLLSTGQSANEEEKVPNIISEDTLPVKENTILQQEVVPTIGSADSAPVEDEAEKLVIVEDKVTEEKPQDGGVLPNTPVKPCLKSPRSAKKVDVKLCFNPDVVYAPDILLQPSFKDQSSKLPFGKRVTEEAIKKEERLKILREKYLKEAEDKLAKEAPFAPTLERDIGKRFETFDQWIDNQYSWVRDRAKVLKKKVAMDKANYEADLPEMSKETTKLLAKMKKDKRYVSPIAGWKRHFDNFAMRQAGIVTPRSSGRSVTPKGHSFTPVISDYAAKRAQDLGLNSSIPPGSLHLGKDESSVDGIPLDATTNQFNSEAARGNDSPALRLASGKNNITKTKKGQSVFDKLYEEHNIRLAAQRVMADSLHESITSNLFQPLTNESLCIIPTSLYSRKQHQSQDDQQGADNVEDSPSREFTCLYGYRRHPDEVVDTLLMKGEEYKDKRERTRELIHQSEPKYPFKPKINKRSAEILKAYAMKSRDELESELAIRGGRHYDTTPISLADGIVHERDVPFGVKGIPGKKAAKFNVKQFMSRAERARAMKEQHIADLRESLIEQETQECTFRPALSNKVAAESLQRANDSNNGLIKSCWSISPVKSSNGAWREVGPTTIQSQARSNTSSVKSPHAGAAPFVPHTREVSQASVTSNASTSVYTQQHPRAPVSTDSTTRRLPLSLSVQGWQQMRDDSPKPKSLLSIPHPQLDPGPRRPIMSDLSSTASERHHHEESFDEDDKYLDNLEAEMQDVINSWRSTADSIKEYYID